MWNRAALMEGPMVAFMVASWYCYMRADDHPHWGVGRRRVRAAGIFHKGGRGIFRRRARRSMRCWRSSGSAAAEPSCGRRAQRSWTLGGLVALRRRRRSLLFVVPNWSDYRFYNWQMSVTRKPSYDVKSLIDRVIVVSAAGRLHPNVVRARGRPRRCTRRPDRAMARSCSRASGCCCCGWCLGAAELILHDAGNERRFVFFIPAFVGARGAGARAAADLSRRTWNRCRGAARSWRCRSCCTARTSSSAHSFVLRSCERSARTSESRRALSVAVRRCSICHLAANAACARRTAHGTRGAVALAALLSAGNIVQYMQWAVGRTYKNYEASRELGRLLPGERWCKENSPTGWRSRIESGQSSSAAGSATTRTGRPR